MTHSASARTVVSLLAFAVALGALGCKGKSLSLDSGTDGEGDGSGSGGGGEEGVVWDDLHLESSVTLTGGFASGAGFYTTGEDGEVYVRSEGEWSAQGVDADEPLNGIWGMRTGEVSVAVAVGDGGTVARLDEFGWVVSQELNTANMESVDSADGSVSVSVGWGGAYVTDGSASWAFQAIDNNPQFNSVWTDGTTIVAVGQDGVIATTRGGDWTVENLPSRVALNGIGGLSVEDLWAVGVDGTVLHKTTGDWEEVDIGTGATLWDVEAIATDQVYIVGNNGFAVRHDGTSATELPTGIDNNLYDITSSSSGVVWAVGNRGATLRLQSGD